MVFLLLSRSLEVFPFRRLFFALALAGGMSGHVLSAETGETYHGRPAPVSENRGAVGAVDGEGRPLILALAMDRFLGQLRTSLLVIDPEKGGAEQYWHPEKEAITGPPFHLMLASNGHFYTMFGETFLEFDIDRREWRFAAEKQGGMAMSFAEGLDGTIYAALYPRSTLLAYDPKSRALREIARLDPQEQYPSSLAVGKDGWLYAGVGNARNNVVAYRLSDGELRPLVPEQERKTGFGQVHVGLDGRVYGKLHAAEDNWFRFENGEAHAIPAGQARPAARTGATRWQGMVREFPNHWRIDKLDLPNRSFRVLADRGRVLEGSFDYESEGAEVSSLVLGPDGAIYGSTSHPMRLWRMPLGEKSADLGAVAPIGGGNIPSFAVLENRLIGASYSQGDLWIYDTDRPFVGEAVAGANPARVANHRPHVQRPRVTLAHPDGRHVIAAGFPGYGRTGGGLFVYDLEEEEVVSRLTHEDLIPGQSTIALRALSDGRLVGGTSILTPGGGHPEATEAEVYLLGWPGLQVLARQVPVPGAREVVSLVVLPEDRVLGITRESILFLWEPTQASVRVQTADLSGFGQPVRRGAGTLLQCEESGRVWVLLSDYLLEVNPRTLQVTARRPLSVAPHAGAVLVDGRVYYGSSSDVWSAPVP
jgi:hypothetical protein